MRQQVFKILSVSNRSEYQGGICQEVSIADLWAACVNWEAILYVLRCGPEHPLGLINQAGGCHRDMENRQGSPKNSGVKVIDVDGESRFDRNAKLAQDIVRSCSCCRVRVI